MNREDGNKFREFTTGLSNGNDRNGFGEVLVGLGRKKFLSCGAMLISAQLEDRFY